MVESRLVVSAARANMHVKLTAERRCRSVPSVLRTEGTPAAAYVRR